MSNRVAIVTGASAGIGLSVASRLHGRGWVVVGSSRRGTGSNGWTSVVMDVDDDQSVTAGVQGVVVEHGRIDAVVASAGWGLAGAVEQTPIAEGKAQLETNFWVPYGSCRPCFRRCDARDLAGSSSSAPSVALSASHSRPSTAPASSH